MTCAHRWFFFSFYFPVQSARLRERAENREANGDEDDSDEDDQIEEELGFISPIDSVNPYTSFKRALTSCVYYYYYYLSLLPTTDDDWRFFL